jgi:hypothetical protein
LFYAELSAGEYELSQSDTALVRAVEEGVNTIVQSAFALPTAKVQQCSIVLTETLSRRQRLLMIAYVFLGIFTLMKGVITILTYFVFVGS